MTRLEKDRRRLRQIRGQLTRHERREEVLRRERDGLIRRIVHRHPFTRGPRGDDAIGISQADLAADAGVSEVTIRKLVAAEGNDHAKRRNRSST